MKAMNYIQQRFLKNTLRGYALNGNDVNLDWCLDLFFGCKLIKVTPLARHYGMQEDGTTLIIGTALNRDGRYDYYNQCKMLHARQKSYHFTVDALPVVHTVKSFKQYNMWYAVLDSTASIRSTDFTAEMELCLHLEPVINDMVRNNTVCTGAEFVEACAEEFNKYHPSYDLEDIFAMYPGTQQFVDSLYFLMGSARDNLYEVSLDTDNMAVQNGKVVAVNAFKPRIHMIA